MAAGARRRGMTLAELLLVYIVIALALALLVGLCDHVQKQAKRLLAGDMVLTLREAAVAYHAVQQRYPPGAADFQADQALAAMFQEPACTAVLATWPDEHPADAPQAGEIRDPWGNDFRYLTRENCTGERHERVVVDGVPIFESAGPDRDFGDLSRRAREDNIASDVTFIIRMVR